MRFSAILIFLLHAIPVHAADPRVGLRPAYGVPLENHIESIAPPVVERGKTTRVTFTGRDFGEALDLWHSLDTGSLKAVPITSTPTRIVMDITASADAPVGVCGLRLATRDGLTNACLLMVDDLPVQTARRGNRSVKTETPLAVWGTFGEGVVDRYPIDVQAGERISFEVVSNRLGKDADPLLIIRDSKGRKVVERDNDPGLYFDLRFEHRFDAAGTYIVEVRDARFKASEHHHYVLRMGRFPAGRVAVPSAIEAGFFGEVGLPEIGGNRVSIPMPRSRLGAFFANLKRPDDQGSTWVPITPASGPVIVAEEFDQMRDNALSQAASGPLSLAFMTASSLRNPFLPLDRHFTLGRLQATPAVVGSTLCGVLRQPGRTAAFQLHLNKGERIFVRGEARSLNSPADLELILIDRSGRELRRAAENLQTHETEGFEFTAPAAGDYALMVRDAIRDGGDAFAYRIVVRNSPFPPRLFVEAEGLTIPQGGYQPISISRPVGSAHAVRLHLIGGPPGLRLDSGEFGANQPGIVCRLTASPGVPTGVYTVQIVAETDGPNGPERTLVAARPLIDMKWQNVDLIPIALREDQMRLPPGLADRLAVQVAPPAPFSCELPEREIVLPRYQTASIAVATTRIAGFDGPIVFHARGGQLAEKSEGRTRVYAEIPHATRQEPNVRGRVVSKILSNTGQSRIEVIASSRHQGRRVELIRSFDLHLVSAFSFVPGQAKLSLLPGERSPVRLRIARVKTFDGPVILHFQSTPGLMLPETAAVPKGQTSVEIDVAATLDAMPRKQGIAVHATADVDGFEEELRGTPLEIEVRKIEPPKKK